MTVVVIPVDPDDDDDDEEEPDPDPRFGGMTAERAEEVTKERFG